MRFDSNTGVAGYDPDEYLRQYNDAGGDLNAMRRERYAQNKEHINAQKRAAYELRQKNRGKKVLITDQAIQKVPLVAPNGVNDQTTLFIQETHRDLLKFSQTQNNSNEVACLLDLTTNERLPFVKGDQVSVNVEQDANSFHWLRAKPDKSVMLCHNHPGQSYFSANDISIFMHYDSIGIMSIVTNQGKIWYMAKNSNFDIQKARNCMKEISQLYMNDYDKIVESFLKLCYNYGVERG